MSDGLNARAALVRSSQLPACLHWPPLMTDRGSSFLDRVDPITSAQNTDPTEKAARVLGIPRFLVEYGVFALIAYIPMLASEPGTVSDDTKTYLYYNPGRLLSEAASLWDPNVALGTVSHQTIGYLLPMGPFYWFLAELHVPVWIAQRLWMGSILFAAGAGMLYLCRTVGLRGYGRISPHWGSCSPLMCSSTPAGSR